MKKSNAEDVRALFFDLDGTLSDYVGGVDHALEKVWDGIGGKLAPHGKQSFLDCYWNVFDEMERMGRSGKITTVDASSRQGRFTRILRELGLDHDSALIEEMSELYTKGRLGGARLFPGVVETLAALRDVYCVSVVTEGSGKIQRDQIETLGLGGAFHHIIVSQEAGKHKPDPDLLSYALETAGASPNQSVMIGDRVDWDLVPARQLGLRTILFTQKNRYLSLKEEMQFEPDWEIDDFSKLLELFPPGHSR